MEQKVVSPAFDYVVKMPGNEYKTYEDLVNENRAAWEQNARVMPGEAEPYKPILVGNFEDGSPEWHAARVRMCVSPSSAGALFGVSPYNTVQDIFFDKYPNLDERVRKPAPPDEDRMTLGHRAEPFVACYLVEILRDAGHIVEGYYDDSMYESSVCRRVGGNIDRLLLVDGVPMIGELKTCTSHQIWEKYWKVGICPPYYEVQVRAYMHIANFSHAYIACSRSLSKEETVVIRIDRDYDVEDEMLRKFADFIGYCDMGVCPPITFAITNSVATQTFLSNRYGLFPDHPAGAKSVPIPESDEAAEIFSRLADYKTRKKDLEKKAKTEMEELEAEYAEDIAKLLAISGGTESLLSYPVEGGTQYVELVQHTHKAKIDEKKLKADRPDLYEAACEKKFSESTFRKLYGGFVPQFEIPSNPAVASGECVYVKKVWVAPN